MNTLKVLLADDSEDFLAAASRYLATQMCVEVVGQARDGAEAVAQAAALKPDLVLMDIAMPRMNGIEATRRIRCLPHAPRVVMLSLHDNAEYQRYARDAGAEDYVPKSQFPHRLAEVVCRAPTRADGPGAMALRESEGQFRTTFEQAAVGIVHVAPDGRFLRVNRKLCDIVGYTRAELLARAFQDITHPDDLEADLARARQVLDGTIPAYSMEKRYLRKDGTVVWADLTVSLVRTPTGEPDYFISFVEDVSTRKRAQEEVRLLQSIALAMTQAPNLDSALEIVLREVGTATGWACGDAWLPCAENEHLQCAAVSHAPEASLKEFMADGRDFHFARGVGLPGRVWDSRRPLWIPDVTKDMNFPRAALARRVGLRAALGVPVLADEEVVAILAFYMREARPEDEHLVGVVSSVAAQLGLAFRRKRMEQSLQDSEARLRAIVDAEPECVKLMKADGTLMQINRAGLAMIEADSTETVVGRCVLDLVALEHREPFRAFIERVAGGAPGNLEFEILGLKGARRWMDMHAVPFSSPATNGSRLLVAVTRDVTEQKRARDRLSYLAHYDSLTGLPNRMLFSDRLQQAMIEADRHERLVGVAFLDLDRFKNINDTLGHEAGDQLLKEVAARLAQVVRQGDTVARLAGDEFAIVLADMAHVDDAARVAQKILDAVVPPFSVAGRELHVTVSLGFTLYPFDTREVPALLRNADSAMYRAKETGRNSYQFYAVDMTVKAINHLALENDLRHAIERGELFLEYQPIVDSATQRITGAEALARWRHATRGLVSPAEFIPIAEESGLILPIGEWVLRTACEQAVAWQRAGHAGWRVAVNVSARQFRHPRFSRTVSTILAVTGMDPERLELELTESVLLSGDETTFTTLNDLSAMGISLSVDDFGTGYSSLSYLKRFPIRRLKVDRSFVSGVPSDPENAAIVRAIVTMAHSLGLQAVAEGVETREQLAFLRAQGCDALQGFLFSRPVAGEKLLEPRGRSTEGETPGEPA